MGFLEGLSRHALTCMLFASIGAILFGFDNGWWGTALGSPTFLRDYGSCADVEGVLTCNLSTSQLSAGSSVQSAGIMVGAVIAAFIGNYMGRRPSLVVTAVISLIGVAIELTSAVGSARFSQLVVGKTIASISMGLVANIVPIYLSETSPAAARGFAISLYQNIQIVGLIISAGCVYATSTRVTKSAYLIPIGVQAIAPGMMIIVSPWLPESPRWLVWKGHEEEAVAAATRLFGNDGSFDAAEYCAKRKISFDEEKANSTSGWGISLEGRISVEFSSPPVTKVLQQGQGSSYMNNYVVSFLVGDGVIIVFPVIMVISRGMYCLYWVAIFSGHFLPHLGGGRVIIISTAAFCGVCLIIVAIITKVANGGPNHAMQNANVALIFLWEFSFGIQSPLIWITTAQAAPTRNREKVLAVATFMGLGVSPFIASVCPYLQNPGYGNVGSKIGFLWGSFSITTVIWLDYLYNNNVPTRKFKGYKIADGM